VTPAEAIRLRGYATTARYPGDEPDIPLREARAAVLLDGAGGSSMMLVS
jgi:hypothetical protein